MSDCIKIYCVDPTPRQDYIFSLYFEQLLGIRYAYVDSAKEAHINYSDSTTGTIACVPHGLLSEKGIRESIKNEINVERWQDTHCFFKTGNTDLFCDIFSAAFYLVSRYEEWLPYEPDAHNRFPAEASVLTQNKLLDEPLVNQWALILKDMLLAQDSKLLFNPRKFEYLSTIDIDQAWKFRHKGLMRNILGTFRDLVKGNWENLQARWPVLLGFKKDPFYEAFDWIDSNKKRYTIDTIFFLLLGDYASFDKNINHRNTHFQKLIKSLDTNQLVGIHPSYSSNANESKVSLEINRLQRILERPIKRSRQHFLMHKMPKTYRTLLANGITEDYTMGYSTHIGFRAGIAAPFYWFDLENNKMTELRLVPFCVMDITPLHYRKESPEQAIESIKIQLQKVSDVGGLFVSLWHNESLSETERWKGWRNVYSQMLADVYELERQTTL